MGGTPSALFQALPLIVQDAVAGMPQPPQPQRRAATRTDEGITAQRGLYPFPITPAGVGRSQPGEDLLHRSLHSSHHLLAHLGQNAHGLQAIVPDALEPLGQNVLHHAPNEGCAVDCLDLPLTLRQVITVPVGHRSLGTIIGQDA